MVLVIIQCRNLASEGPRLQLPCTQRQDHAITALQTFLTSARHEVSVSNRDSNDELDRLLVELLAAIYFDHIPSGLSSVVEIVIMLLCMKKDGSFHEASYVSHLCGIFRYSMRNIDAHTRTSQAHGTTSRVY
jgi:hypothetical protein